MSSFARTTHHLADQIKDSTTSALADFGSHAMKMLSSARDQETHAVNVALEHLGLQRRQSALRPAVYFAAGAVVAGGIALIFAPTLGKRIRAQVLDLLGAAKEGEKAMEQRIDTLLTDSKPANTTPASVIDRERARIVPPSHS
jgi:hypothetical protein